MSLVRAIDRKVLRDLWRTRGQLLAIALVMACGVGVFLGMRTTMRSLESARTHYYARQRFADVFAQLERAPLAVADRLGQIRGVQRVATRIVARVTLDVPGVGETISARLVSLPERGRPALNDLVLRSGRWPAAGRSDEVLAGEQFVEAHGMPLGTSVRAVIHGRAQRLTIVGSALSPEFLYALPPGQIFPDDRRFGIFWMRRDGLAAAYDMEGAFNDVSLALARDAVPAEVIARADEVLARHGGTGAIAQRDQQSAFFIENELAQLRTSSLMVPVLFLLVSVFLLSVVIGRLVAGQREQIAALKALGYRDREVGAHYAKLVAVVLVLGCALGGGFAVWIGTMMTRMYVRFYRFPELPFRLDLGEAVLAVGLAVAAAALGTWAAIRRAARLPPAEAMRPEAPPVYRATILERVGLARLVPPAARIVMRELERRPLRALLSVLGIAMATAMTIVNAFTFDSIRHVLNVQFGLQQREDLQVTLLAPRATSALSEIARLPGVVRAEPMRSVPVRLRAGPRERTAVISGYPRDARLRVQLDSELHDVPVPRQGLLLSRKLAELLGVAAGSEIEVEVLEGQRVTRRARVARVVETYFGIAAIMELDALCALLREPATFNAAWLVADRTALGELHAAVKQTPVIAGVTSRTAMLDSVRTILDENLGLWVSISLGFSLLLALGVLYNSARIALAERAHELASLRVLGFRRREVAAILLGELGVITLLALPIGLVLGRALAAALVESPGFNTEQFRLPLVVAPATYALAVLTVVLAAALSGIAAWRGLERVDIVEVLKTRD